MILMGLYIYYINCRIIIFGLNMVGWEREKLFRGRYINKIEYLYKFFRIWNLISFCLKFYFIKFIKVLLFLYFVLVLLYFLELRKYKIFEILLNIIICFIKLIFIFNLIICCMFIMVYVMCNINKVKLYIRVWY